MPELPEVETVVRGIAPHLVGRQLRQIKLYKTDVLRGVSRARLLRTLAHHPIRAVSRRAKHVIIMLRSGDRIVIQPRMTGTLLIYDRPLDAEERRYVVLEARFGRRGTFAYRDVRRLGTIALLDEPAWAAYTARIGPEPLTKGFDRRCFADRLAGTRQAIKKAIMDQARIAGVGNIYANEALFRARIHPARPADRLDDDDRRRLYRSLRHVLRRAVDAGGTTIRDYRNGDDEPGSYQQTLLAYGRGGRACGRCRDTLVTTHGIDGRASTYCPTCQPVPR